LDFNKITQKTLSCLFYTYFALFKKIIYINKILILLENFLY